MTLTLKNASMANIGIHTYYHNSSLRYALRIKWKGGEGIINCAKTVQFFIEHKVLDKILARTKRKRTVWRLFYNTGSDTCHFTLNGYIKKSNEKF